MRQQLLDIYQALLEVYGPQGWWPGEGTFEVMVGAILAQNTAWRNAERGIARLKEAGRLSPAALRGTPPEELEELLRPAGTYRRKAQRLRALVDYLYRRHGGEPDALAHGPLEELRRELLEVHGVGPETADSILLYATGRPSFVVDAYTRRLLFRLGWTPEQASYEDLRALFMQHLPPDPALFNEYHALIVRHAKERCRKRAPRCGGCPLESLCRFEKG
ncbi:MAG: hypothetical protein JXA37_06385 [Chloroflexia bacterium]|nr:hypothetical protein [Chloroflexia bacterium]